MKKTTTIHVRATIIKTGTRATGLYYFPEVTRNLFLAEETIGNSLFSQENLTLIIYAQTNGRKGHI